MGNLQVISYDYMEHPLLSSSLECCTNLRVLCLQHCSLAFDSSSIGNLLNLEVLNFSRSRIKSLPSTIGNLKKLRVLDVTGCGGLHMDNGVFKNLVRLEELYACSLSYHEETISFTGDNCNEVAERWKNLSALEFEFFENNAQWKNLSFKNLERFKISVGRSLKGEYLMESKHSFENTLKLVMKKGEVSGSRINELVEKTVVLCLSVDDMNDLEIVVVKPSLHPESSSFPDLRILVVSKCAELKYLFTLSVAKALSNLEHLKVSYCPIMKELIHNEDRREETITLRPQSSSFRDLKILVVLKCADLKYLFTLSVAKTLSNLEYLKVCDCPVMKELIHNKDRGEETITFPKLKLLLLSGLRELLSLGQNVNVIALPQLVDLEIGGIPNITSIYSKNKLAISFLSNEEVLIPKLEHLCIWGIKNLKEIWPRDFSTSEEVKLRKIEVRHCENLVSIFPCNPIPLLCHLEQLEVRDCGSIEALFNIDLDYVDETGEGSSLRSIGIYQLENLREVWRIKGGENNSGLPIRGFQAVESISIYECKRFSYLLTPTTTNFDLGALTSMVILNSGEIGRKYGLVESSQGHENTLFPAYLIHSIHNLGKLELVKYKGVEVIFEIKSTPRNQDNQHQILPYLENLYINDLERLSHVWKCNWNEFLLLHRKQSESPFHNLTTIEMRNCHSIKYLFSPLMAKLLSNLKKVKIKWCDSMQEVVSNRDDDEEEEKITSSTALFPLLDSLTLKSLQNLKCIGGGEAKAGNNKISSNSTTTTTSFLDNSKFSQVDGNSWSLCQYPREISINNCNALSSVIPWYAAGQMKKLQVLKVKSCDGMKEVFETQWINKSLIMLELKNLKKLEIYSCDLLEHIFTFSTLESLEQLEELMIKNCKAMKVIVVKEEDDGEQKTKASFSKAVVFPLLKLIELVDLPELVGFFLGTNHEFQWPSLDDLVIKDCPEMKVFTAGGSTAPQLKHEQTSSGKQPNIVLNAGLTSM